MTIYTFFIKYLQFIFSLYLTEAYLAMAGNKVLSAICYVIPSSATFEGVMDLANGGMATAAKDMVILVVHCAGWFLLYLLISKHGKKQSL